jgi:hypothetical protein
MYKEDKERCKPPMEAVEGVEKTKFSTNPDVHTKILMLCQVQLVCTLSQKSSDNVPVQF